MEMWTILGIAPTKDLRAIKSAYARTLKLHSPETDPQGFQKVRLAYEQAQAWVNSSAEIKLSDQGDEPALESKPNADALGPLSSETRIPVDYISAITAFLDGNQEEDAAKKITESLNELRHASVDSFSDFEEALLLALAHRNSLSAEFIHYTLSIMGWGFAQNKFSAQSQLAQALSHLQKWFEHHVVERVNIAFSTFEEKGATEAITALDSLYQWPLLDSNEARAVFQTYFIYRVMSMERWPLSIVQSVAVKFGWDIAQNPFSEQSRYHNAFIELMTEYLRYRNRILFLETSKKYYDNIPREIIDVLFGPFDPAQITALTNDPNLRDATHDLMSIAKEMSFPEEFHPIETKTREFWSQRFPLLNSNRSNVSTKKAGFLEEHPFFVWLMILLLLVIIRAVNHSSNAAPASHSRTPSTSYSNWSPSENMPKAKPEIPAFHSTPNINLDLTAPPPRIHMSPHSVPLSKDYRAKNPIEVAIDKQLSENAVRNSTVELPPFVKIETQEKDFEKWINTEGSKALHR